MKKRDIAATYLLARHSGLYKPYFPRSFYDEGGGTAGSAGSGVTPGPNYVLSAGPGTFTMTGEDMTIVSGLAMGVGAGTFNANMQNVNFLPPTIPLALDGATAHANINGPASGTVNITTTTAGSLIILAVNSNAGGLSLLTSSPSLTWTVGNNPSVNGISYWWAKTTAPGTFTLTFTPAFAAFTSVTAFSVRGGPASPPYFDGVGISDSVGPDPLPYTNTAPNALIFAMYKINNGAPLDDGLHGFTQIDGADYAYVAIKIVSSVGTHTATVSAATGAGTSTKNVVHAVKQGP